MAPCNISKWCLSLCLVALFDSFHTAPAQFSRTHAKNFKSNAARNVAGRDPFPLRSPTSSRSASRATHYASSMGNDARQRSAFDSFEDFMERSAPSSETSGGGLVDRLRALVLGDRSRRAHHPLRAGRYQPWGMGTESRCGSGDGGLRMRRQQRRFRRKAQAVRKRIRSVDLRPPPSSPVPAFAARAGSALSSAFNGLSDLTLTLAGVVTNLADYTATTFRCTTTTSKITALSVLVFGAQLISPSVTAAGAKVTELILNKGQYYRLLTPIVLHGGVAHLAVNMYSLANLGPLVDRTFGTARFLGVYLAGGVAGNVFSTLLTSSTSVGASGAIFGLVGAYYVFLTRNKRFFGASGEDGLDSLTTTIVVNIGLGLTNPVIDNWAHIGGCLGGALAAYAFGPRLFLARTPSGSLLVDSPLIQIPEFIRNIPRTYKEKYQRVKQRLQYERYSRDLNARGSWKRLWWF